MKPTPLTPAAPRAPFLPPRRIFRALVAMLLTVAALATSAPGAWSYTAWTGDGTTDINPATTLYAYHLGDTRTATVNGVSVPGSFQALSNDDLDVAGNPTSIFSWNPNNLTALSGTGSPILASAFNYNGVGGPMSVTAKDLTAGQTYTVSFFATGFDPSAPRNVNFTSDTDSLVVNQNAFGYQCGIRVDYTFVAAAATRSFTLMETDLNAWGLSAVAVHTGAPSTPPTATTGAATAVGSTTATLNGVVNANGSPASVVFQYGTTTGYGALATAAQSPVSGSSNTPVSAVLSGLTPNTTYHFRIPNGTDATFTTPAIAVTGIAPASGSTVGGTTVTISGTNLTGATAVSIGGTAATNVTVVDATTITASTPAHAAGAVNVAVTTPEGTSTLTSGFTYVATPFWSYTAWTGDGTTDINPATTLYAYHLGDTRTATVNGVSVPGSFQALSNADLDVNGNPTSIFSWNPNNLTALSGTGSPILASAFNYNGVGGPMSVTAKDLTAGQTYTVSFFATGFDPAAPRNVNFTSGTDSLTVNQNAFGYQCGIRVDYTFVAAAATRSFTLMETDLNPWGLSAVAVHTGAPSTPPTATTGAATAVGSTTATLNGVVNANGSPASVVFQYGTTTGYGALATAAQSPVSGSSNTPVSAVLSGLTPNTTYHFRIPNGTDAAFTTPANTPPVFRGCPLGTTKNTPVSTSLAYLLTCATDADGGTLSISQVSAASIQGGTAGMSGNVVNYTPPAGYTGLDIFTVTITDGQGGSTAGTVTVSIAEPGVAGGNQPQLTILQNGKVALLFPGTTGQNLIIQRSTDLGTWATLQTGPVGMNGTVPFTDASPPPGTAFYRAAVP